MSFKINKILKGTISARWFENKNINLEKTLFVDIVIPVEYSLNGKKGKGELVLDFIRIPDIQDKYKKESDKVDFSMLKGKAYTFPKNPEKGYIDSSFYLFSHNPFDVDEILFESVSEDMAKVRISGVIDFTYEGVDKEVGMDSYPIKNLKAELKC
ncbi:MAG: hypothetical protein PHS44_02240 [Candidatus Dojkabacteria bacterium]|nr:hypothetical protein [Candidatus Dojkabacteria bacterium]